MEKKEILERQQHIIDLIKPFCTQKLDDEYFDIAERLVKKLGRKRSVPFVTGQPQIWAASVIHAIGTINFLFDKASQPYDTVDDISHFFGTNKTTTTSKSKQIRELLKMSNWDNEFSTKRMMERNPFANLVMINGFIVPLG